ncbi:hypothetical protein [Fulvimarina manganoxydans]|uniref:hypothetical protein n=1 Tax=Fulvimarina manganoxydans TaxID=937218 RepID=UPI000A00EDD5|nr:hypothetical protein [Fulvimarina manganoxydans]
MAGRRAPPIIPVLLFADPKTAASTSGDTKPALPIRTWERVIPAQSRLLDAQVINEALTFGQQAKGLQIPEKKMMFKARICLKLVFHHQNEV